MIFLGDSIISFRALLDLRKDLFNRGKVSKDHRLTVHFVTPNGDVEKYKGYLSDDFKSFKIEGIPGKRLLKAPLGFDPTAKKCSLWASYNSLTNLDFRQFAVPYEKASELSSVMLEDLMGSNDLRALATYDYTMYMLCFGAGGFFTCLGLILLYIISRILIILLSSMQ